MRSETRSEDKPDAKEALAVPHEPNLARMLDQAQVYLDLAGVMFVALDPEGKVVLVNRKGGMILGCAPSEIVGRDWFDTFVPPLERARVRTVFDDLMSGRLEHAGYFENSVLTKDGRTRLVAWHNAILQDEAGRITGTLGSGEDITERKRAMEEIKALAEFPAQNPNPVLRVAADGTILYANQAGAGLLALWSRGLGDPLPDPWRGLVVETQDNSIHHTREVRCGTTVYALTFTPVGRHEYVNVYGLDITELKQAEEVLRQSEENYRTLAANLPGIVYRVHLKENNRMQFFNDQLVALTGYGVDELSSGEVRPIDPLIHEDDRRMAISAVQQAIAEHGSFTVEYRFIHKDGSVRHFIERGRVMEGGDHQPLFIDGVIHDITASKQAESEREITIGLLGLLNASSNLRELIQSALSFLQDWSACEAVGIRLHNGEDYPYYETRGFPPEFVEVEKSLCNKDLEGQLLRDDVGNPVLECMCGNILCGRFDPSKPFFTTHGSFWTNCTTELLASTTEADRQARTRNRCNGEGYESVALIPLRMGGVTLGLLQMNDRRRGRFTPESISFAERLGDCLGIALAQRMAVEAMRESEMRYRTIFEQAGDYVLMLELGPDGMPVIVDVNESGLRAHGYSREELLGKPISFLDPELTPEMNAENVRIAREGRDFFTVRHRRKDGSFFNAEVRSQVVHLGTRALFLTVERDITERKKAEEELIQAQRALADQQRCEREHIEAELARVREELIRATRLAAIGQVSASIAHDLRNPLGTVRNASFLLKRRVPPETRFLDLLRIVDEEVSRADQIITRLLSMARTQMPPKQRVDLGQVIAAVFGRIEPMRQVRLAASLDPDPFWVQADPVELDPVISNLMTNAAEAMAGKGTFSVEAVHGAGEDTIVFRDTGPGIAPEIADTLFDPLVTTKARGTGLGLTICRQIVGRHGGTIQAANAPEGGAVFTIRLPQA